MTLIVRYFWFIGALFMVANIVVLRRRSLAIVNDGLATKREMDQFIGWVTVGLVVCPSLLGLIGLVAKGPSVFCGGILSFADLPRALTSLIVLASWVSLLWWVWRGDGADFLARVVPALGQRVSSTRKRSPGFVRLVVTAMVLGGGLGSAIMWRAMPMTPDLICPVSAVAS